MALDSDLLSKLVETFKVELDEKLQIITNGLLELEQNDTEESNSEKNIEEIFRAAHNIKGSSHSIGISDVGVIAHHIESIFSSIRDKKTVLSPDIISLCLIAIDGMHSSMKSFCDKTPLDFDLQDLIAQLERGEPSRQVALPQKLQEKPDLDQKSITEPIEHDTIRVSIQQINRVSSLLEELQANKISIDDHYFELHKLNSKAKQYNRSSLNDADYAIELNSTLNKMCKNMHDSIAELGMIFNSLQEEVRMLRLIPASSLLRNVTRLVRDLAIELDKKIKLEINGDGIKMDKMVLEGLKDPIIHLLRNAIDHGIEPPDIRKQNGKSEIGLIRIDVIDEGDQIFLKITDDGAGINYKKIASMAELKNIISKSELDNMDKKDVFGLIFRSGFTTKEIITDISGRGIGLNVVKSNLEKIKGDVTITSEPGKGSTFQLRVPLTLSSDSGLTIRSGGQVFVIPSSTVERVMLLQRSDIKEVEGSQVIIFDNKPILVRRLSDILKLEQQEYAIQDQLPVIVLKKGLDVVALLVEEIIGEREIVIKPLSPPLVNVSCVAGGTLSGSGQVIIVLNASDVINTAMSLAKENIFKTSTHIINSDSRHHILLVDDSITTRTLEKNMLENNNYKVTVAVDGVQAWDLLQKDVFSLLITDIEMPNMNGIDLTERVKQSEKLHNLPVIIVTSLGNDAQKKRGIDVGANAYIVKHDFESKELLEIVAQLV